VAATAIVIAYVAVAVSTMPHDDPIGVAGGIQFVAVTLGEEDAGERRVRSVHPSYAGISSWISSVGAAVTLADLDSDGLPNDACHVDPRNDSVTVRPAPGSGPRYSAVRLIAPPIDNNATVAPMGCVAGDLDEDGRLDLIVYYWGRTPVGFLQRGDASAPAYRAFEVVTGRERWFTNAGLFTDLDGDGHADLVFGNYFADGADVLDASGAGVQSMQQSMSRARNGGKKQLWRSAGVIDGTPHFVSLTGVVDDDVAHGWTLAVGAADLDGDGRPELMFANDFGPDDLLHNRTEGGHVRFVRLTARRDFTTPASKVLGHDSFKGMGVDFGDVNRDGKLDMFVSNIAQDFALEESHQLFVQTGDARVMAQGRAPYRDLSEPLGVSRSGWGWDARFADFNNDGALEILQATGFIRGDTNRWPELHELAMQNDTLMSDPRRWPKFQPGVDLSGQGHNPLFMRRGGGRFHDVAALAGTDQKQVTRGLAVADIDADGLLDYAVANQWEASRFYRNTTSSAGAFVGLNVLYPTKPASALRVQAGRAIPNGSPAVGAAVEVTRPDGQRWVSYVDGGSGHSGKRSADVHVGLGAIAADAPLQVAISWRTSTGVKRETFMVRPGWHTVWLPTASDDQRENWR
jgi:hypothetical protein